MPSYSAQTLINNALVNLGVLDQGGIPSVSDSNEAFTRLNYLLGQWRIQQRFIYEVAFAQYALTANMGVYPIGPTATAPFAVPPPNFIVRAYIALTVSGDVVTFGLDPLTAQEFNDLADLTATAKVPQKMYYDRSSPNGTINLYPRPLCAVATYIQLLTWVQISNFANLAATVDLPDGYPEAISNALGLRLCNMFGITGPQMDLMSALAKQAEDSITALNVEALGMMKPAGEPAEEGAA